MAPSLENYEEATANIPVKVVPTQVDAVNGAATLQLEEADKHDHVLRVFRCLIADLCEQFKGGHPGYDQDSNALHSVTDRFRSGAMGMAAIGISLWKYAMKYSPSNPLYFNRDRFVLSNGISAMSKCFSDLILY